MITGGSSEAFNKIYVLSFQSLGLRRKRSATNAEQTVSNFGLVNLCARIWYVDSR